MNYLNYFVLAVLCFNYNVLANYGKTWWKHTEIYEVYVWSFKDSNGDGIGDIKGVTSMLDHFADLKIETLWLSPYFKSPMRDTGYDVMNFTDIEPNYGTMEDFNELMKEIKKRGMKVIMDFVINHSSNQHPWFVKSENREEPYTDFYIWKNAKGSDENGNPVPPNNWISVLEGSAWKWSEKRKQFYLHQFSEKQPDFNLRSSALKRELKNTIKFWFDKGVSGLRLDAPKYFMEDSQFRDEPLVNVSIHKPILKYNDLDHIYTADLWETYEFIHELREFIDHINIKGEDFEKILIAEVYTDTKNTMLYYGSKDFPIVHFPFNLDFVSVTSFLSAKEFDAIIQNWLKNMPEGAVANWITENNDYFRVGNRLSEEYMDILTITTMLLPGVVCIYYGQEIGLTENNVRPIEIKDQDDIQMLMPRDTERLPMQWDDSTNAGFTSKLKPWLPINPNYWRVNVRSQRNQKVSRYNMFKTLMILRRTGTAKFGSFKSYIISPWVYAFSRTLKNHPTYIVLLNLGSETEMVHLHNTIPNLTPALLRVVTASMNAGYVAENRINSWPKFPRSVVMRPMSAIVLTSITKA